MYKTALKGYFSNRRNLIQAHVILCVLPNLHKELTHTSIVASQSTLPFSGAAPQGMWPFLRTSSVTVNIKDGHYISEMIKAFRVE